jgi:excisionase family DNA binding protein
MPKNEELEWNAWTASLTSSARAEMKAMKASSRRWHQDRGMRRAIPEGAYLSLREVARLLRVSQGKVADWIQRGRLKALDVGRPGRPTYRVDRAALIMSLEAAADPPKAKRQPRNPAGYVEKY